MKDDPLKAEATNCSCSFRSFCPKKKKAGILERSRPSRSCGDTPKASRGTERPDFGGRVPKRSANRRRDMGHAATITMRHLVACVMRYAQACRINPVTNRCRGCFGSCYPIGNRNLGLIALKPDVASLGVNRGMGAQELAVFR